MPLCGSTSCGCAIASTPATTNAINGTYPTINVSGSGTAAQPWDLTLDENWAAEVADRVDGAWTTFTPTWNNCTIGDATVSAAYRYELGGLHVRVEFAFGPTTTAFTGSVSIDLPNSETSRDDGLRSLGSLCAKDGTLDESGHCMCPANDTTIILFAGGNNINATAPFTWASGDNIQLDIVVAL